MNTKTIIEDFDTIIDYSHFWNWKPDWSIVKNIYLTNSDTYSVFTPFAYSYLEEMIRSTTTEYGLPLFHKNVPVKLKVGMALIAFAKEENKENEEYIKLLDDIKIHFDRNCIYEGNGRNRVLHGHLHPRFWHKEDFEKLLHDIALLSPFSKF